METDAPYEKKKKKKKKIRILFTLSSAETGQLELGTFRS